MKRFGGKGGYSSANQDCTDIRKIMRFSKDINYNWSIWSDDSQQWRLIFDKDSDFKDSIEALKCLNYITRQSSRSSQGLELLNEKIEFFALRRCKMMRLLRFHPR